jgi:ATP-dependent protease Clp ATPase subunit
MKAGSIHRPGFRLLHNQSLRRNHSPARLGASSPPQRPYRQARLASIPSPKSVTAHFVQFVIEHDLAEISLALGVSNHFKCLNDTLDRDAPDPIVADPDLHDVRLKKSNILRIGTSVSGKTHLLKSLASYLTILLSIGGVPA